jgi:hypothetical protein
LSTAGVPASPDYASDVRKSVAAVAKTARFT